MTIVSKKMTIVSENIDDFHWKINGSTVYDLEVGMIELRIQIFWDHDSNEKVQ